MRLAGVIALRRGLFLMFLVTTVGWGVGWACGLCFGKRVAFCADGPNCGVVVCTPMSYIGGASGDMGCVSEGVMIILDAIVEGLVYGMLNRERVR
jgi:hypothetical protein